MSEVVVSLKKTSDFESAGVGFIASSGRSLALDVVDKTRVFSDRYYISLKDLDAVLNKRKKTATIFKIVNAEPET